MPFALLIIGVVLLVSGVRGTQDTLFGLLKGDFTGDTNFFYWFISIIIIGVIGYIPKLKPVSTAFLVLIIMVLFLTKGQTGSGGGFFQQFTSALQGTQTGSTNNSTAPQSTLAQQSASLKQQAQGLTNALQQNLSQSASALAQDIEN